MCRWFVSINWKWNFHWWEVFWTFKDFGQMFSDRNCCFHNLCLFFDFRTPNSQFCQILKAWKPLNKFFKSFFRLFCAVPHIKYNVEILFYKFFFILCFFCISCRLLLLFCRLITVKEEKKADFIVVLKLFMVWQENFNCILICV